MSRFESFPRTWITVGRPSPFGDRALTINAIAYRAIGSPPDVLLLWDGDERALGICAAPIPEDGWRVSASRQVSIRGIVNRHGLDLRPGRYPAEVVVHEGRPTLAISVPAASS